MRDDELQVKLHLHRLAVDRFIARRAVEWRLAFSLWAVSVPFALGLAAFDEEWAPLVLLILASLAVGFHIQFQRHYVYKQMFRDWKQGIACDREIREAYGLDTQELPDSGSYRWQWAHAWQPFVTLFLWAMIVAAGFFHT